MKNKKHKKVALLDSNNSLKNADVRLQDPEISSTTAAQNGIDKDSEKQGRDEIVKRDLNFLDISVAESKHLLARRKAGQKWFEHQFDSDKAGDRPVPISLLRRFETYAQSLLDADVRLFQSKTTSSHESSKQSWLNKVSSVGTLGDRVAAMALLVQESPAHRLKSLDDLIEICSKKARRETLTAIDNLKDLFIQNLLPDRHLILFKMRPLLTTAEVSESNDSKRRDRCLLWWLIESNLKDRYLRFIELIETAAQDQLESIRIKVLKIAFELLCAKAEQEAKLLALIVNKLGDPVGRVASRTAHLLTLLLQQHPLMCNVVLAEVERLVFRPNVSTHAQYYSICFLGQIRLSQSQSAFAARLLQIYFTLFNVLVKRDALQHRILAALLQSTNRAFPFAKDQADKFQDGLEALYKVVATGTPKSSIQALTLLFQLLDAGEGVNDRYYSALYRKLAHLDVYQGVPVLNNLFSLVYKSLKADPSQQRRRAFVKCLLQVALSAAPSISCAILVMLIELKPSFPALLNLKHNEATTSAFEHGCHGNVGGDDRDEPQIDATSSFAVDDDDEDEHFVDIRAASDSEVDDDDENATKEVDRSTATSVNKRGKGSKHLVFSEAGGSSWVHRTIAQKQKETPRNAHLYRPDSRNPLFVGAENCLDYELLLLFNHFHPSVALFARYLLQDREIDYSGNPLEDFTLTHFLDRFVFKNPKKSKKNNLEAKAGNKSKRGLFGQLRTDGNKKANANPNCLSVVIAGLPLQSDEFVKADPSKIPVDEHYLHKYFRTAGPLKSTASKDDDVSDVESVNSEEFEMLFEKLDPIRSREEFTIDFSKEFKRAPSRKRKHQHQSDSDDDDDDDDDADGDDVGEDSGSDAEEDGEGGFAFADAEQFSNPFDDDLGDVDRKRGGKKGKQKKQRQLHHKSAAKGAVGQLKKKKSFNNKIQRGKRRK